jgi:hypothetical protein
MSAANAILYVLGAALIVVGLGLLFFETGLAAWVPPGIAIAGLVIIVGMMVLGLSGRTDRHVEEEHHHHHR